MHDKAAAYSEEVISLQLTIQAQEAKQALSRAGAALSDALKTTKEVDRVSSSLLHVRSRNRFAEMMLESFRGHA